MTSVVVGCQDRGDGADDVTVVEVHHTHPCRIASLRRDGPYFHADGDAVVRHRHDLVVETDHEGRDHFTLLAGEPDAAHTLTATSLGVEAFELGALAEASLGE